MEPIVTRKVNSVPNHSFEEAGLLEYAKGGNWIQGAVNPAHKGFCTPLSKSTCTGARRRFALTMKAHHGFHKKALGGAFNYMGGGTEPEKKGTGTASTAGPFKVASWKSQGLNSADTLSRGTMYHMTPRQQNQLYNIPIPSGTNPDQESFLTVDKLMADPNSLASKLNKTKTTPVSTYDIAGNPTGWNHPQGANIGGFRKGGTLVQIHKKPGGSNVCKK